MALDEHRKAFVVVLVIFPTFAYCAEVDDDGVFKPVNANHAVDKAFSEFAHFFYFLSLFFLIVL
jgi:hypothetical protein